LGFEVVEIDNIDSMGSGKWLAITTEENWKRCLDVLLAGPEGFERKTFRKQTQ
jgi:hypothetical protein